MSMTRRDFEAIAHAIAVRRFIADTDAERDTIDQVAADLANVCKAANGNFDRDRFLAACQATKLGEAR